MKIKCTYSGNEVLLLITSKSSKRIISYYYSCRGREETVKYNFLPLSPFRYKNYKRHWGNQKSF